MLEACFKVRGLNELDEEIASTRLLIRESKRLILQLPWDNIGTCTVAQRYE
jgi:hypothetical protein